MDSVERRYLLLAVRIFAEFGAAIAVPVVLTTMLGGRYDAAHGTRPFGLIAGFAIAAIVSAIYITHRAKAYGLEYEALGKPKP